MSSSSGAKKRQDGGGLQWDRDEEWCECCFLSSPGLGGVGDVPRVPSLPPGTCKSPWDGHQRQRLIPLCHLLIVCKVLRRDWCSLGLKTKLNSKMAYAFQKKVKSVTINNSQVINVCQSMFSTWDGGALVHKRLRISRWWAQSTDPSKFEPSVTAYVACPRSWPGSCFTRQMVSFNAHNNLMRHVCPSRHWVSYCNLPRVT